MLHMSEAFTIVSQFVFSWLSDFHAYCAISPYHNFSPFLVHCFNLFISLCSVCSVMRPRPFLKL